MMVKIYKDYSELIPKHILYSSETKQDYARNVVYLRILVDCQLVGLETLKVT